MVPSAELQTLIEILEVRSGDHDQPVTITAAMSADAIRAIFIALSEQRDRNAQDSAEKAEDVLALREQTGLVERFGWLAAAEGHAAVCLSQTELRTCVFELTRYVERVEGGHYQPRDLRSRVQMIGHIGPVLWEANALAAATDDACGGAGVRSQRHHPARR